MLVSNYLDRIRFNSTSPVTTETLFRLHEAHVFNVPFEDIDIHYKKRLSLKKEDLFDKVVNHNRGGFCYELNYLFHLLLTEFGFKSTIISCRIFTSEGFVGPEFDHMAIIIDSGKQWLLDVGFGDLFIQPIELIENKIQFDGRNYFKIEKNNELGYVLLMSSNQTEFEKKYTFTVISRNIEDFEDLCIDKEINPNSYFVQNTICTRPTPKGRMTIFNNKFIEKINHSKSELSIENDDHLKQILKDKFEMIL
jgi:N-hydroxyarylamine O-acetyltransferase